MAELCTPGPKTITFVRSDKNPKADKLPYEKNIYAIHFCNGNESKRHCYNWLDLVMGEPCLHSPENRVEHVQISFNGSMHYRSSPLKRHASKNTNQARLVSNLAQSFFQHSWGAIKYGSQNWEFSASVTVSIAQTNRGGTLIWVQMWRGVSDSVGGLFGINIPSPGASYGYLQRFGEVLTLSKPVHPVIAFF